ncbi:MAG: TldD/PmbA family protein [Candidatus Thorarchaeota archaeon]
MIEERDLLDLCKAIVDRGKSLGADAIEVHAEDSSDLEATIEMAQVSRVDLNIGTQIAIRVFLKNKVGSAFTNIPTKEAAFEALELAIAAARATTVDENLQTLPDPSEYKTVAGLWNDAIANAEASSVAEISAEIVKKCISLEPDLIIGLGGSGMITYVRAYANSSKVETSERGAVGFAYIFGVAPIESGMTPGVLSFDIGRREKIDIDRIADEIVKYIRIVKKTVSGKSGKFTVIMHPGAYNDIMNYTLLQSVRGDNVARGKSKIGDKIGEKIASDIVSIYDDGLDTRGLNSSISDDEGVPRQRTPLIEKGVLRSFLWDNYWAKRMGVKSTGNARRNKRQGLVEVATSNIIIEPGSREIDEIISEIEYGYYIHGVQGAHSSNPESGDFSVVGNPAILIENGKLVGAVHGLMVSGNIYDLLKQTVEIAKTPVKLQTLIGPEIKVQNLDIIAKE